MEKLERKLELVAIDAQEFTTEFKFLDDVEKQIVTVTLFKGLYDGDKKAFYNDAEQAEKFENNLQNIFGELPSTIDNAIGSMHELWLGDNEYYYLWEPLSYAQLPSSEVDVMKKGVIEEIKEFEHKTIIVIGFEDKKYKSNINYGEYIEKMKEHFVNPKKKEKQIEKFEKKMGVKWDDKDSLVGKKVTFMARKNNFGDKDSTFIEVLGAE